MKLGPSGPRAGGRGGYKNNKTWFGARTTRCHKTNDINPLKPELNPIYLLALLAHHFLHVSRIRVKLLTLR